jgi:hypothetical protein
VAPRNPISHQHFLLNDMFCHDRMTHATLPLIFLIGQVVAWGNGGIQNLVPPFHCRKFLIVTFLNIAEVAYHGPTSASQVKGV